MNILILVAGFKGARKILAIVLISLALIISLPFMAVASMGSEVLGFLAGVPNVSAAENLGFYTGEAVAGNYYEWGNCTWWAFSMRHWSGNPIPVSWGNANTWDDRARTQGFLVNNMPAVGAVFQSDAGRWGHVAYVTDVNVQTGEWTISEMNYKGLNIVSNRTFSAEMAVLYSFIH